MATDWKRIHTVCGCPAGHNFQCSASLRCVRNTFVFPKISNKTENTQPCQHWRTQQPQYVHFRAMMWHCSGGHMNPLSFIEIEIRDQPTIFHNFFLWWNNFRHHTWQTHTLNLWPLCGWPTFWHDFTFFPKISACWVGTLLSKARNFCRGLKPP